jgi:predicted acylesterase/phospholipase RssA
MADERRIALTLSGGGFRATLFHLGVVRFLRDAGFLGDAGGSRPAGILGEVKRIAAVSGGSVLAAHLVLNWHRYIADSAQFDEAAAEVVSFVRSDVRGRVVRRWILAWLTIVPRVVGSRRWTFTSLLEAQYRRLYGDARLHDLNAPSDPPRPQVFFNCTSLSTGSPCAFGPSGFMWYEEDVERPIVAPDTKVAFAVTASSAFPPLFPPVPVSHKVLSCDRRQFPNPHYLTDGGVYDNLGIDRLLWHDKRANDIDLFLMSDAEGNFDWDFDKRFTLVTTRNIRASALLMKRVSALEYGSVAGMERRLVSIRIEREVSRLLDGDLFPEIQRTLRNIRTDLDNFSRNEIACLVQHGFTVARETCIANGLVGADAPTFPWKEVPGLRRPVVPDLSQLRGSASRRFRLWSVRDWTSWATLLILAMVSIVPAGFAYASRQRLRTEVDAQTRRADEQAAIAGQLGDVNVKLTEVAVEYFKQRHRPVTPGMSAAGYSSGASTICCVVQQRGGGKRFFLLGDFAVSKVGDALVQPGPLDGGKSPQDSVGRLVRILKPDPNDASVIIGSMAEIASDVEAYNIMAGLGPIHGVAETVVLNQQLFIAGRTTGLSKVYVSDIDLDIPIPVPGGQHAIYSNVIGLRAAAGPPIRVGDAGAPVITTDGRLAAMVFAGSDMQAFAVPIRRVFEALQVELAPVKVLP